MARLNSYLSRDAAPDLIVVDSALHSSICPSQIKEVHRLLNLLAVSRVEHIFAALTLFAALAICQVFKPTKLLTVETK